jgi:beta-1,4-mannosyl-glycoprotein beta-1,4-N-acetylglucosaminyltransferase
LLYNIVDYFIIVESTHTHVGKEKTLYFNENKHLFDKFTDKIIHIIVDDFPYKYPNINIDNNDAWYNEEYQRNAISQGITYINNLSDSDLIIISDLDEIPDPYTIEKIKKGELIVDINCLEMDMYYYNLNTKLQIKWWHAKIISFKKYNELKLSCSNIRFVLCSIIVNGGWHLSYFGNEYFIKNKLENFAHQEYNNNKYTDLDKIVKNVQDGLNLFDDNSTFDKIKIKDNTYLPTDYSKYLNKYYN